MPSHLADRPLQSFTTKRYAVAPVLKAVLPFLAAAGAVLFSVAPGEAQEGGYPRDVVLVTPDGRVLDFIPEDGELQAVTDRRGRTVLVDGWGNVVATAVPADGYRSERRRSRPNDVYRGPAYEERPLYDDGFGGEVTGSLPEFRDVVPQGVERGQLPEGGYDPNDMAAIDPNDTPAIETPRADSLPKANPITAKSRNEIVALQVFLDREGFSPGVIDGKAGGNVTKAIEAFQKATGETLDPNDTEAILERLRLNGGLPITNYTITAADAAGPYVAEIPDDYAHKAQLTHLSFTSTTEMLAERFHMDEAFLKEFNPGVDFTVPGTIIKVVVPGGNRSGSVARIVADKGRKQVFAYDAAGGLIAAYPASIGSADTPSPSGIVTVDRIALDPGYTYNPKINFKQGNNDKVLTIPPGPNGPVGTVWIALSKPTYGIHGTPEPSKIGKTQSHGCIRLTNWDATELAKMVTPGVTVEFVD
ncbi:L,D-transpeptidase family protein [Ensifer soli]|uniref:L,D-transpeptidase family protein n=1 Tax=Ciceribacter sp. sgz301302 TaxID=3342379 RepID=UPI0035B84C85